MNFTSLRSMYLNTVSMQALAVALAQPVKRSNLSTPTATQSFGWTYK